MSSFLTACLIPPLFCGISQWMTWIEPFLTDETDCSADCKLSAGSLHLWYFDVSNRRALEDPAREILQPPDETRASRFLRPEPKSDFMIRRGLLRRLLGFYTGRMLFRDELEYNAHGQPLMPCAATGRRPLSFSVSHTGTDLLFAFALCEGIGADIEEVQPRKNLNEITHRACSPEEIIEIENLPESERLAGFYRIWTLKEAISKAGGTGLTSEILEENASDAFHCYQFMLFGRLAGAVATIAPVGEFHWQTCHPEIMLRDGRPSRQ